MGAVMVSVAVLMARQLDLRFQSAIADDLPAFLVNPSRTLEASAAATDRLARVRGDTGRGFAAAGDGPLRLPVLGDAPELRDTQRWFNTRPLSLASLRRRVVLLDFWTYLCVNCIRTLPHVKAWDTAYRRHGLTVIGVHAPEFPFERDAGNVARRSPPTACATRSSRTTTSPPGAPTATSTGRRST